jgi:hypothetical protein
MNTGLSLKNRSRDSLEDVLTGRAVTAPARQRIIGRELCEMIAAGRALTVFLRSTSLVVADVIGSSVADDQRTS